MKKICIIIHLYYVDLWDEIKNYIDNIEYDYDMYITLVKDNKKENQLFLNKIKNEKNIFIYFVDNKGMDIGPFLYIFNKLIKNNLKYDYILKLHTKKGIHGNRNPEIGKRWRYDLINPILKNKETVDMIISLFDDGDVGVIGSKKWLVDKNHIGLKFNLYHIEYFREKLKINTKLIDTIFIGGTMFWSRFDIYYNFFKNIDIMDIYSELETGAITDSGKSRKTHALERILSMIMIDNNKKIIGV